MRPTERQLKKMATHLQYEVRALHLALKLYTRFRQADWAEWVIGLEAFLLHARVLHEFFSATKRSNDNLMASDYMHDAFSWRPVKPIPDRTLKRVNKQLAHLSISRADYLENDFDWSGGELGRIYEGLKAAYSTFIQPMKPDYQDWFS